ncbi:hypothetical protein BHE90_000980 [Fusarium euwallaceae]|uniref:Fucose-specific lectin n=4 Tax=Fusarium solani species complex TaxID=232080 RepID=A0A3M2S9N3_9HYPO|nr:hypothetical protein CDV36_006084 [Fusarium kuroshium]RSL74079.1 hypothetical protein CEP53_000443 [Fusarium sp. AF-6]RSL83654.1 hypothetical protein CEP51_004372 [Fusarium floridanum]RSL98236.1 hypothetical protein CEP52_010415 [Fusarium oligoseptatum]RTE84477.1 hypothetical protein BHE90_000980 [Fusarium euwallaceae]
MVAVTAILDDAGAPETQLHLYYNLENKNLGLQFRNENDSSDEKINTFAPDEKAHPGFIVQQSYLASTKFNNQELIFGITEKKGFTINQGGCQNAQSQDANCPPGAIPVDVSLVSPVYKVLSTAYSDNFKIAACSSAKETWTYYLKKNPKNGSLNIYEATIGPGNDIVYDAPPTILQGSALAAYYDSTNKTRYIIFQGSSGNLLNEYAAKGSNNPIKNAKGVKKLSTIAVAVTKTTVFLYYLDDNNMLNRVTKQLGGNKWTAAESVDAADSAAADGTQLTVTTCGSNNHIFYQAQDQASVSGFTHVIDPQVY